jgi:hypothetical protein
MSKINLDMLSISKRTLGALCFGHAESDKSCQLNVASLYRHGELKPSPA